MVNDQAFKTLTCQNANHRQRNADSRRGKRQYDDVDRTQHPAEELPAGLCEKRRAVPRAEKQHQQKRQRGADAKNAERRP